MGMSSVQKKKLLAVSILHDVKSPRGITCLYLPGTDIGCSGDTSGRKTFVVSR
jgi:hypothetical protein